MPRGGGRPHPGGPPPRRGSVLPAVLLALAVLGPLGCGASPAPSDTTPRRTAAVAERGAQAAPAPSASAVAAVGFNDTDRGWAQLMAAMDERTLLLLDLIADRASDAGLADLARRTTVTHRAELTGLRAILRKTGADGANPHEGHDMKGMVTDDELRAITAKRGAAFDDLSLTYLREHLEQSVLVSRGEQSAGGAPEAKKLAAEVTKRRTEQLAALRPLGG
ncbi:DUF305 domain-containing protein [Streptomyces liangshanensis]|uniref:DUF305 domain-containing protein n=1 Tax=Streptomyces liangshanensis TaxID=2717324 RepID=A0A6G9H8Q8_9ACTN|nr:DUF305 domain-containing protein [Streptomyces liangshanensis]QIQ06601.1 DUF305 domain-containing protein [Streptomyces liangshanensis]